MNKFGKLLDSDVDCLDQVAEQVLASLQRQNETREAVSGSARAGASDCGQVSSGTAALLGLGRVDIEWLLSPAERRAASIPGYWLG
jgi:hypothetical protein